MQVSVVINIGKKTDLSDAVKSEIVKSIANGMRSINIVQEMLLNYHTFKKKCRILNINEKKSDRGSQRKNYTRKRSKVGRKIIRKPLASIK